MNSASWAGLVILPTIIAAPGRYVARGGEEVVITHTTKQHEFRCVGKYASGQIDRWHKSGRLYFDILSDNDIVSAMM